MVRNPSLRAGEVILWCLLLVAAIAVRVEMVGGPELYNDSYQYLSAAENVRSGAPSATSIIHFDAERSHGRIAAPLTTFPAGYAWLIALVASLGMPPEQGGMLLSALATLALLPMFAHAAALLGVPANPTRVLLALLVASSVLLARSSQVITEPVFTALTFGALLAFLSAESRARPPRDYLMLLIAANLLIAAAFWVRYAGLFLFISMAAFHVWRRAAVALASMALSATLIGAGLLRNHLLTGSWMGGNGKQVENSIPELLYRFGRTMYQLFLGEAEARIGVAQIGLAAALVVILALGVPALWRRRAAVLHDARLQLLAAYIAVYIGAMLYLGARSVISFGPRMFVPLLPVLLLLCAGLYGHAASALSLTRRRRRMLAATALVLVAAYTSIHLPLLFVQHEALPHHRVQARLDAPAAEGPALRLLIEREVDTNAPLVANDGQATAYLLQRKVLSLVSPRFSEQIWSEEAVRGEMTRFGARHLLIYPGPDEALAASDFLSGLASGTTPAWLKLVADNGSAKLFVRHDQP